jgi:bacterial/archaeal transporter family-2 protein
MFPLLLMAMLVGLLLPIQAGVNAQLRTAIGDPIAAALLSFLVGTLGLGALMLALRVPLPLATAWQRSEWTWWIGGLLGAAYVGLAVVLAPRIGAGTLTAAVVAGQMLTSIVLDHFGWVGFAQQPLSPTRLLGAALVVGGVVLIQR